MSMSETTTGRCVFEAKLLTLVISSKNLLDNGCPLYQIDNLMKHNKLYIKLKNYVPVYGIGDSYYHASIKPFAEIAYGLS